MQVLQFTTFYIFYELDQMVDHNIPDLLPFLGGGQGGREQGHHQAPVQDHLDVQQPVADHGHAQAGEEGQGPQGRQREGLPDALNELARVRARREELLANNPSAEDLETAAGYELAELDLLRWIAQATSELIDHQP